jgi:hypothetical protein
MIAERLPSADRSQSILNSAGRRRDSAARLCSAFYLTSGLHKLWNGFESLLASSSILCGHRRLRKSLPHPRV